MSTSINQHSKFIVLIVTISLLIIGITIYNYIQLTYEPEIFEPSILIVNQPRILVTPKSYDLGDVVYGDVAEYTFTVKNIGGKPLEILRLSTSCGCTSAEIAEKDKIIESDANVNMVVSFDPAVMDDPTLTGPVQRVVYIKTNDPDQPEFEVDLIANVIKAD